jgi:glycine cleavage system aminomethyltransferase T
LGRQTKSSSFDVKVRNVSENYSQVAIQGPEVIDAVKDIMGVEVHQSKFMTYASCAI